VKTALERADGIRNPRDKGAAAAIDRLDALAGDLERDAAAASARDAVRLRSLATTLKERATRLR
jgi:hypothetical protein